jgi:EmrB/QacA subfamily drug resistance transporter
MSPVWTLVAAILGSGLAFIDGTVVNVALPAIQHDLRADTADAQWVIESYALFLSALLLVGGALGDRLGRRRVFMIGAAVFCAASLACALSNGMHALEASRAVQGVGAALMVPGSLSLISATYPPDRRGRAIGTWSAFSGITAAVGPVLGGFLVDHFSWRWAFLVNLPIGAVLLAICAWRVPESRGEAAHQQGIDVPGALLATLGLAGVVFAFIEVPVRGWGSGIVMASLALGIVALALFVRVEMRGRSPMLSLSLFRERDFGGANLLTLLLYAALGGGLFFFPLDLIQVQGYDATSAGAALLPFIAILFVLSRWAGRLVDRWGARRPLIAGPLIAAAGFALFARPSVGGSYWRDWFPAVCVLGLGMTITVAPLTTTVMNAVGEARAGIASGVNNAVSRVAGLLAIAVFGVVMTQAFHGVLDERLAKVQAPPTLVESVREQRQRLGAIELPSGADPAAAASLRDAIAAAFVAGFRRVMWMSAALAVLSAASAWWWIGRRGRRLEQDPVHARRHGNQA